ncbi:unnamed protein product [Ectocarpus sp. 4 AP-2014]
MPNQGMCWILCIQCQIMSHRSFHSFGCDQMRLENVPPLGCDPRWYDPDFYTRAPTGLARRRLYVELAGARMDERREIQKHKFHVNTCFSAAPGVMDPSRQRHHQKGEDQRARRRCTSPRAASANTPATDPAFSQEPACD